MVENKFLTLQKTIEQSAQHVAQKNLSKICFFLVFWLRKIKFTLSIQALSN